MANTKSALKRIRQSEKRRLHNRHYRNRTRTFIKQARAAIEAGDVAEAEEAVRVAQKELDMTAKKGIIHKRNADRRKSRLMQSLNAMKAAQSS